jgi:predicted nucleic acid-binding protein
MPIAMPVRIIDARQLGEETGLTADDASHLWQARQVDAPLVTLDRKLAQAAGPEGYKWP